MKTNRANNRRLAQISAFIAKITGGGLKIHRAKNLRLAQTLALFFIKNFRAADIISSNAALNVSGSKFGGSKI